MQICFVLVEPQVPENIGAAARALKTMGFADLRLVNTSNHQRPQAQWLAHGSTELLEQAQVFDSLAEALADCSLAIGTTAKLRNGFRALLTPEQLGAQLRQQQAQLQRVAIVFGREDRGLSNEELGCCQLASTIPLVNSYPSLNLGQAVMLYAYALASVAAEVRHQKPAKNADAQFMVLRTRVEARLQQLGYDVETPLGSWAQEQIVRADVESVRFLHALCAALEKSGESNK